MKWSRSRTRAILLILALCGISLLAWQLISREPATLIGFAPFKNWQQEQRVWIWTTLTMKEFKPNGDLLLGSVEVEVRPGVERSEDFQQVVKDFPSILLRLDRYLPSGYLWQGASDGAIALTVPAAASTPRGNGTFSWKCDPLTSAFYYPFDRYLLHVNPSILRPGHDDSFFIEHVSQFITDFTNTNFIPLLLPLPQKTPQDDSHSIELQRPAILRLLAVIVGCLLVIWLIYLRSSALSQLDGLLRARYLSDGCSHRLG